VAVQVRTLLSIIAISWVAVPAGAGDRPYPVTEQREACGTYDPLRRPFFGDTHVHTAYSFDASTQDTRNTPRDAYRFARGERIGIQPYDEEGNAQRHVQLQRPLDFVAVTDHAELLGDVSLCMTPGSTGFGSIICWIHRNHPALAFRLIALRTLLYDRSASCHFTSFVGYEWTATVMDGINLHRNVIFRNERVPELPISWVDTPSASDLWDHLQEKCVDGISGCDVLTIPHNSNISAGLMFATARLELPWDVDVPVDAAEARRRAHWEPLIEIMQHKGDSECALGFGSNDETCGFEKMAYDRFGPKFSRLARLRSPGPTNFVRWALKEGLRQQATLGANSLKFGIIASTDTHIAAPGLTEEKDHPGHGGAGMGAGEGVPVGFPDDLEFNPGGLAVVWAEENTRDAIFAAMRRRETYGTSGTRPVVRFFGGWDVPGNLCGRGDFAERGYAHGVPMGGDLPPRSGEGPPRLALWALRDPGASGVPLQRIQVVKGWVKDGELHERVIDVAGGPNDAGVDLATCEPRGAGASDLCAVWSDPDFDPGVPAFYYGRVLENPTCRWSQFVCNAASVDCSEPDGIAEGLRGCCSEEHQPVIQERAWTSPIWYTP
jgi:hypothetical protein